MNYRRRPKVTSFDSAVENDIWILLGVVFKKKTFSANKVTNVHAKFHVIFVVKEKWVVL